jgi:septum formation protein
MKTGPVILASASPRRAALLRELGVEFEVLHSSASEIHHEQMTAGELCQINAYRKARAVAKRCPEALVLGADTLVYLDTQLFGKPRDLREAGRMLAKLQGRTHQVITGVCLMELQQHRCRIFAESTAVTFRALGRKQIGDYLSLINPLDKAGAYAIQEHGEQIVENIDGSWSNVVGLPVERLKQELDSWSGDRESQRVAAR